jgi:glycosyltransferase involved in cell wall biosynthesis
MKITFLSCVKNEEKFVSSFLDSLLSFEHDNIQIIVVDDRSSDSTYEIVKSKSIKHPCIEVYKNDGKGKVDALNTGYRFVNGEILKLVDGDDLIAPELAGEIRLAMNDSQLCVHDFELLYPDNSRREYKLGKVFFDLGVRNGFLQMKSLPKACWSFTREVYEQIFPIPTEMPYEDIWISMRVKLLLADYNYKYIKSALYIYRQHNNQTFGGLLDYSKERVKWRARRNYTAAHNLMQNPLFVKYKKELNYAGKLQKFIAYQKIFPPIVIFKLPIHIIIRFILLRYFRIILPILANRKYRKIRL